MRFTNGIEEKPITSADLEMVSSEKGRIVLRYTGEWWGDACFNAMRLAQEVLTLPEGMDSYNDFVSSEEMYIGFMIASTEVIPFADLRVVTTTGQAVKRKFLLISSSEEVKPILDCYFSEGCKGLSQKASDLNRCFYERLR